MKLIAAVSLLLYCSASAFSLAKSQASLSLSPPSTPQQHMTSYQGAARARGGHVGRVSSSRLHATPSIVVAAAAAAATTSASAAQTLINLDRVKIRLEGLGPYAVVATLILNSALRLFSMYKDETDPRDKRINFIYLLLISVCIVTASYTSVVFTMISVYSKTAIGLGKDAAYHIFFTETQKDRAWGYRAFQLSLATFLTAYAIKVKLLLKLHSEDSPFKVLVFAFVLGAGFMGWRLFRMGDLARTLIFS